MKKVIFGLSLLLEENIDFINMDEISYFIDNDKSKQGREYYKKKVFSFDVILKEKDKVQVIVALSNPLRVEKQLSILNMLGNFEIITINGYLKRVESTRYNPKVSILIPTYNRADLVVDAINSAINQKYCNIEVIINDNNSSDDTSIVIKKLMNSDSRITYNNNNDNIGAFRNWYECLKRADGELCKIVFSDDYIYDTYLEETVPFMKDDSVAFVTTIVDIGYTEKDSNIYYDLFPLTEKFSIVDFLIRTLFKSSERNSLVSPGAALFRTKDLLEVMEHILSSKEWDRLLGNGAGVDLLLYLLIANKYDKMAFVKKNLCYFRAHKGSITINDSLNDNSLEKDYKYVKKYYIKKYNILDKLL